MVLQVCSKIYAQKLEEKSFKRIGTVVDSRGLKKRKGKNNKDLKKQQRSKKHHSYSLC